MNFLSGFNANLLDGVKRLHFIGIGGSGMYPLVQILHARGYTITGSDVNEGQMCIRDRFGPWPEKWSLTLAAFLEHLFLPVSNESILPLSPAAWLVLRCV